MEFVNPKVQEDLDRGVPLKLNLGSGGWTELRPDFYGVDFMETKNVSILADLNKPLDLLPDNSVSHIYSNHCLEHIEQFLPLMKELHRVVQPDGELEIIVPHFSNPYHYSDPTHVRFFGLYTMFYFVDEAHQPKRKVPTFYSDVRFRVENINFRLFRRKWYEGLPFPFLSTIVNQGVEWQDWYERRLCHLFPTFDMIYQMTVVK